MGLEFLLGIILTTYFTLIMGNFAYTYRINALLWKALNQLQQNDIRHCKQSMVELETRLTEIEHRLSDSALDSKPFSK